MTRNLTIFLQDILISIKLVEKRMKNVSYQEFIGDVDLQDMVIRRIEIIGEAVRNLPKEFRQEHREIDWQSPADMRSVLIHGYFGVDFKIVWDTVINDLPKLKEQVKKILQEEK